MRNLIHYIPVLTTIVSAAFAIVLFRRWAEKRTATYLLWWGIGVFMYGLGTLTESLTTIFGWNELVFRVWYISGALFGAAPLAQGTVYLLFSRRVATILAVVLVLYGTVAAVFVLLTPIDMSLVETYRLSGRVMEWGWVRLFSPFINLYALIFLVGGAAWSAWQYWRKKGMGSRVAGNVLIAAGALLPGIGGSMTRIGYVEVLYVTEIIGITLIWLGYYVMVSDRAVSIHTAQQPKTTS
ncbi:MAG: hypothetical protein H3C34_14015 [Caldilineaceae bacterium]|nr:hypothetical protein [Caldilineaceae bacterium]